MPPVLKTGALTDTAPSGSKISQNQLLAASNASPVAALYVPGCRSGASITETLLEITNKSIISYIKDFYKFNIRFFAKIS